MILVLLFAVLAIAGFIYMIKTHEYDQRFGPMLGSIFSIIIFVIMILVMVIQRSSYHSYKDEIESVRQTLKDQRKEGSLENAALTMKVIEVNKELAGYRYWIKNPWTSWFYHPGLLEIEPIK